MFVTDHIALGQIIRHHRHAKGWSQDDLAANAGVSRIWLAKLETGKVPGPQFSKLRQTLRALDLTMSIQPAPPADSTLDDIIDGSV